MRNTFLILCLELLGTGPLNGQAKPQALTIFHTNDIHGHFVPERAEWRDDRAFVGGFTALEQQLTLLRSQREQSIYLDAGDLMTGNPVCNIEYHGVRGAALLDMLNQVQVTAQCLGNHEFDLGSDHVLDYLRAAPYPILCANVVNNTDRNSIAPSCAMVTVGALRIGIVGLITDELPGVVSKKSLTPFNVLDDAASAQPLIDSLDQFCDLMILLTHCGVDADSVLAQSVHGIDVIIGGHSHTRLKQPKLVNHVVIAQAGSYCKNLGVLDLVVDGDSVVSYNGRLVELLADTVATVRTPLGKLCDSLETVIQARYGQVIGTLAETWTRGYYVTSNVGNWICDQLRDSLHTDIALVNAGGIRANWQPGPITMLKVLELLPFENSLVTFEASGADLRAFAQKQAEAHGLEEHGVVEMSGLTIDYSVTNKTRVDLKSIEVQGKPLDDRKTYRIASIDFVAISQADRYLGFAPKNLESTDRMLSDFIINTIRNTKQPLRADAVPRIKAVP